jgi:hypothetical protein
MVVVEVAVVVDADSELLVPRRKIPVPFGRGSVDDDLPRPRNSRVLHWRDIDVVDYVVVVVVAVDSSYCCGWKVVLLAVVMGTAGATVLVGGSIRYGLTVAVAVDVHMD